MPAMLGADPDALRGVGEQLADHAARITTCADGLGTMVLAMAWNGHVADDYLNVWEFIHSAQMRRTADFLWQAAQFLERQAQEQIASSSSASSSGFADASGAPTALVDGALFQAEADARLAGAKVWVDSAEQALLARIGPGEFLDWVTDNAHLLSAAGAAGLGDSVLTDFLRDTAAHAHLPTDERIVHGIAETMMKAAADQGISQAGQLAGAAIVGMLTAGVGAIAGRVVGWAIGEVLAVAARAVDEAHRITDRAADLVTQAYRAIRDDPDAYLPAPTGSGAYIDAMRWSWDTGTELVPQIGEVAQIARSGAGDAIDWLSERADTATAGAETAPARAASGGSSW